MVGIEVDSSGYAWVGTESGLVRFDGGDMRTVDVENGDAVSAKRIRRIIPTGKGEIIVQDARGNIYLVEHTTLVLLARVRQRWGMRGGVPSAQIHVADREPRRPFAWDLISLPVSHALSERERLVVDHDTVFHWQDSLVLDKVLLERSMHQCFFLGDDALGLTSEGRVYRIDTRTGRTRPMVVMGSPIPTGHTWPLVHWHDRKAEAFVVHGGTLYELNLAPDGATLRVTAIKAEIPPVHTISDIVRMPGSGIILIGTANTGLYLLREDPISALRCTGLSEASCSVFAHTVLPNGDLIQVCPPQVFLMRDGHCSAYDDLKAINGAYLVQDHEGLLWFWREDALWRYDHMTGASTAVLQGEERMSALKSSGDSMLMANSQVVKSWRNGRQRTLARPKFTRDEDIPRCCSWPPTPACSTVAVTDFGSKKTHRVKTLFR